MPEQRPRRAVFLDRDGVINVDHGYVSRIDEFEFVPGIFALARFIVKELGWPLIVVTNQAGIGRGYFTEESFQTLTRWMCDQFAGNEAPISKIYHCPYHPEAGIGEYRRDHPWRKPKPGMILQAASDLDLDLPNSVLIGDKLIDMQCAAAAGIGVRILIDAAGAPPESDAPAYEVGRDLAQALELLRVRCGTKRPV